MLDFPKATGLPPKVDNKQQILLPDQEPAVYASDVDPKYTWGDDKQPRIVVSSHPAIECSRKGCGGCVVWKKGEYGKCPRCGKKGEQ